MAPHFDVVDFVADAAAVDAAERLRPLSAEVIFYAVRELVRNAARHGHSHGSAPLRLSVTAQGGAALVVTVADNGVGGEVAPAGAGQGLALHAAMLAVVGATLVFAPTPQDGVSATIQVALE